MNNKILILGGAGMLGHKAYQVLSKEFDTYATFRKFDVRLKKTRIFDFSRVVDNIDIINFASVEKVINEIKPDFVINCVGIIKQLKESKIPKISIYVNSYFPHLLADYCEKHGSKLIHVSTDCVFSGKQGNYKEDDISDSEDLYGRTKYLGEINYGNSLTLRSSIVGHELFTNVSLVDWFLAQINIEINGFTNAIYSGFPTVTFCNELARLIRENSYMNGLFNISSEKISKFDLLCLINKIYDVNLTIKPQEDFYCDRSLNSDKYRRLTNFQPSSWDEMIVEMYNDYKLNKEIYDI